jgi:hypothetical protein
MVFNSSPKSREEVSSGKHYAVEFRILRINKGAIKVARFCIKQA